MTGFETKRLPDRPDVIAPDGSGVRILLRLKGGSMAHFELAAGQVSKAVVHRTVEEIWYFLSGQGRLWRRSETSEEVVDVGPGLSITIPTGTRFQFRCDGPEPLTIIGVTMPPWPGEGEAQIVEGCWEPTL